MNPSIPLRVHAGLALAALWPVLLAPLTRMVGHPDGDVWNHAWGPWWFWESATSAALPWTTEWLNAPTGGTLWFIDPTAGLLGMLAAGLIGPYAAYNLVIVVYLSATSWAAARLAERLAGPGLHCLVASLSLLFGPYLLSEVHNGISEACNLAPAILALTAAHDAMHRGRRRDWLGLGFLLGLTALGSFYYLLGTGLVLAVWGLFWLAGRPSPQQLRRAVLSGVVAACCVLPIALSMKASVEAGTPLVFRQAEASELLALHNAVDPRTYFWPGGFQSVDLAAQGEAFLHSGYIGFTVLLLVFIGWRSQPMWSWIVAVFGLLVLGLGARLYWGEDWVTLSSGATLALPYGVLQEILPSQAITHSLRVAMPALVLLAATAAVGLRGRSHRLTCAVLLLVPLEMVLVGGSPWPPARTEVLDTEYTKRIRQQETSGIVLDLPGAVGNTMATSRYFLLQTHTRAPVPYRPDARAMTSDLNGDPTFGLLALASEYRPNHRPSLIQRAQEGMTLRPSSLWERGVRWVVVHRDLERGNQGTALTEALLTLLYGEPEVIGMKALYKTTPASTAIVPPAEWIIELTGNSTSD